MSPLIAVEGLTAQLGPGGPRVLDEAWLSLHTREIVGVVGESGSGKSTFALALMGLLPPAIKVTAGAAFYLGDNLFALPPQAMRARRGRDLAMIFQEPMSSLNPVMRIGDQIGEALRLHRQMSAAQARADAVRLLAQVEFPDPARRIDAFPHELSGGQRQRVMIAIALAGSPRLLIADEPTTALDVTIQAQILALMRTLRDAHDMAILLITHDLGVVAELCDTVAIMYAGRIVESGPTLAIFDSPAHPYTQGLIASRPKIDADTDRLAVIEGAVAALGATGAGCAFAPRCPRRTGECAARPPLRILGKDHVAACFHAGAGL